MLVYIDNDVYSTIARQRETPEKPAIDIVMEWSNQGKFELVMSDVHGRETARVPPQHRGPFDEAAARFAKVRFIDDQVLQGFNVQDYGRAGFFSSPIHDEHPISAALRQIGLDRDDAHHLTVAIANKCAVFLTCDGPIIHHRRAVEAKFAIFVLKPSESVAQQSTP